MKKKIKQIERRDLNCSKINTIFFLFFIFLAARGFSILISICSRWLEICRGKCGTNIVDLQWQLKWADKDKRMFSKQVLFWLICSPNWRRFETPFRAQGKAQSPIQTTHRGAERRRNWAIVSSARVQIKCAQKTISLSAMLIE